MRGFCFLIHRSQAHSGPASFSQRSPFSTSTVSESVQINYDIYSYGFRLTVESCQGCPRRGAQLTQHTPRRFTSQRDFCCDKDCSPMSLWPLFKCSNKRRLGAGCVEYADFINPLPFCLDHCWSLSPNSSFIQSPFHLFPSCCSV